MSKVFVLGIVLALQGFIFAGTLEDGRYYTWQLPEPNVPGGSTIASIKITLHELTTAVQVEGPGLVQVRLVNNPPPGWVGNEGRITTGTLLAAPVSDANDVTIDLAEVELPDSWTHRIFKQPFFMSYPLEDGFELIRMNAAILEYNDLTGNNTPAGLLLRAVGGKASLSRISVKITIRAYTGAYRSRVEMYSVDVPVDTTGIEAWAARERAKLMASFLDELKELEGRIAAALGGE